MSESTFNQFTDSDTHSATVQVLAKPHAAVTARPTALSSFNTQPFTINTLLERKTYQIYSNDCLRSSQQKFQMPAIVELDAENPPPHIHTKTIHLTKCMVPFQFKLRISDEFGRRINSIDSPGSDLFDEFEKEDDKNQSSKDAFRSMNNWNVEEKEIPNVNQSNTECCRKCGHGIKRQFSTCFE